MRKAILWMAWLVLCTTWLETIGEATIHNHTAIPLFLAVFCIVLAAVLYFAEGLELAVADLRDKDPRQLRDPGIRKILTEMQTRSAFFFAQRQIFVVVIITFLSLVLDYDSLYFWPYGEITNASLKFAFSMLFVTFTVLWFCQVAPKRLAIINSELFLSHSKLIWPLIKLVSVLDLPGPSDQIVNAVRRTFGYDKTRQLLPSRAAYFNHASNFYGYAVDTLAVDIEVHADGRSTIAKRYVTLFLHGRISSIYGRIYAGFSGISSISSLDVKPVYFGMMSSREDLREMFPHLDTLSAASWDPPISPEPIYGFSKNLINNLKYDITKYLDHDVAGREASWEIRTLAPLPEGYQYAIIDDESYEGGIAILVYDVFAECSAGILGRLDREDYWLETIGFPCRKFSMRVHASDDAGFHIAMRKCQVGLGSLNSPLEMEQERCTNAFVTGVDIGARCLEFPVQGVVYKIEIDVIHDTGAPAVVRPEPSNRPSPVLDAVAAGDE